MLKSPCFLEISLLSLSQQIVKRFFKNSMLDWELPVETWKSHSDPRAQHRGGNGTTIASDRQYGRLRASRMT
jgi:hypothetical protein